MAQARLIEGAATTPALGWRATCRQDGCEWDARDVSKFRVDVARIHHEHPTFAPTYRNIREDTTTRSR
jgi:hypothetical protein